MVREVQRGVLRRRDSNVIGFLSLVSELSPFGRVGEQLRFLRLCMVM